MIPAGIGIILSWNPGIKKKVQIYSPYVVLLQLFLFVTEEVHSLVNNGHLVLYQQVRQLSFCMMVVVASQDPDFLITFAKKSLSGRLLVWATRLVVVTSLSLQQIKVLLPEHWTFSMMNAIFLNMKNFSSRCRQEVYEVFVKIRQSQNPNIFIFLKFLSLL